jgi:hypothetical protein
MATTTETTKTDTKMAKPAQTDVMTKNGVTDDEFATELVLDRPSFKPEMLTKRDEKRPKIELYDGPSVDGFWLAHRSLGETVDPETGKKRPMNAYIVKLCSPCVTFNRDDERVESKAGDQIIVWETAQLLQVIPADLANHPTQVVKMRMSPQFRAPHPTNPQWRMWNVKFFPSTKTPTVLRSTLTDSGSIFQKLYAQLPKARVAPVLPEGAQVLDEYGQPVGSLIG